MQTVDYVVPSSENTTMLGYDILTSYDVEGQYSSVFDFSTAI